MFLSFRAFYYLGKYEFEFLITKWKKIPSETTGEEEEKKKL